MNIEELSDIQSESGIIGTLLCHPEFVLHTDYLKPNYFFDIGNGCLYWSIQDLYKEGITNIDAYNLSNKINSNKRVKQTLENHNLPSIQEITELYSQTARHTIEEYKSLVKTVVDFAFKRSFIKKLKIMEQDCYQDGKTLATLSGNMYNCLDNLTKEYVTTSEICTLGEQIDSIWTEIVNRRNDNGQYGIPSKYISFNNYFTYEKGELVMVQAKYKRGKSVLLMNEVVHKLLHKVPVLIIDTEMQTRLYVERLISHLTGVSIKNIKSGNCSDVDISRIKKAISWIKEQPLVHIYEPQMTDEKMYIICKMLKYKMGLQFVVFDYLKSNATSASDNYNILGARCDFLKNRIAGELELAVLSACQLNREGKVADSDKINRYISVGIKWDFKTQEMIAKDGLECGNAFAKIYVNRLGEQMIEDDDTDYIDFNFSGDIMTISETQQHERNETF